MAFLREIPKVKDPNENKQLLNYIYALEEQLRYVYANLGAENLIDGAVGADQLQAGSITTEKIAAPALKELQLQSQKAVRILAKETDKKFAEVEVGVEGIRETVKDAEDYAYSAVRKAEQALSRVEGMQGQADFVQYDEPVAKEIGDKWTKTAAPPQTWGDLENMTWGDLENKKWGDLNTEYVAHYVWDGKQWLQIVNEEDIAKKLSEIDQKNTKIALRVEEVAEEEPKTLRNSKVVISLNGIQLGTSGVFIVESGNFEIDADGNVTVKGKIISESGSIGGWDIAPGSLKSGEAGNHVSLSTEQGKPCIWAGAEDYTQAPFRVDKDGNVYLAKVYYLDEQGNASEQPSNLAGNLWKLNKSVKTLEYNETTKMVTIELYNGDKINFKRASDFDTFHVVAAGSGSNSVQLTTQALTDMAEVLGEQRVSISQSIDDKRAVVTATGTPANGAYVDCTGIYNKGWNDCVGQCKERTDVFTIAKEPEAPLYMYKDGVYTQVSGYVQVERANGVCNIPRYV